ncbi:MAG: preprotein translocase subunit SecE [Oligoflexales bacterium]|nr:preprotein translocase subunit SecE [Oligoflexales bacterium]
MQAQQKDDSSLLNVIYAGLFFLVFYVTWRFGETVALQAGWLERYDSWLPQVLVALGVVVALSATFWVVRDGGKREYLAAAIAELRKVTWPSADDTKKMTIIVVVVVGIFAVILSVFDFGWSWVLRQIIA